MKWCLKITAILQHLSNQEKCVQPEGNYWFYHMQLQYTFSSVSVCMYNVYWLFVPTDHKQNVHVLGASIKISIHIDTIAWITNCSNLIKVTNDEGILALTVTIIISDVPVCYQIITSPLWDHVDDMLVFEFPNTSDSDAEHNARERHQQDNGSLHCISIAKK